MKLLCFSLLLLIVVVGCKIPITGEAKGGRIRAMCNDNIDNEGDNLCDYNGCKVSIDKKKVDMPADPGCDSLTDNTENDCVPSLEKCDGIDNDCDRKIDEGDSCIPKGRFYATSMPSEANFYTRVSGTLNWTYQGVTPKTSALLQVKGYDIRWSKEGYSDYVLGNVMIFADETRDVSAYLAVVNGS